SPHHANGTSYAATLVAIVTLEAFAGMWINAFIVSVICMAWIQKKSLNSNEKILLLLGFSRFGFLCISCLHYLFSTLYPNYFLVHPLFPLISSLQTMFNNAHLWVSTCLCGFYCIKIANFNNSFFIYLKVKIDTIVPWLLVGSLLFSVVNGILVYDVTDKALSKNLTLTSQGIIWKSSIRIDEHFSSVYFISGFQLVTSFTAVTFSALLLLFSLWRHKRNMQANSMKDLSMDAHIKAMKSILSFLVMYSINFGVLILALISSFWKQNHVIFLIYLFLYAFPAFHSLILIYTNPKLEKSMRSILCCRNCKVCIK
ncbi:TA2R7 protein, partial [Xiphorhynchus elegans]|nr:TA2R7 protein [Xiphorhynchus elegans]